MSSRRLTIPSGMSRGTRKPRLSRLLQSFCSTSNATMRRSTLFGHTAPLFG